MTEVLTSPAEIELLVPEHDVDNPVVSIVVPALNEELTVGTFVDWCLEGLAAAGVVGEILIVDSSTDRTPEIALAGGARVLRVPRCGLGRAYIDSVPWIRGRFVIVGDADCTYDFRQIRPFLDRLEEGHDFVMGSRFRGSIERGAMPLHHRYFGTPLTTWILNLLFSSRFSDIHCGMRAMTRDALVRMRLSSQGWEYASEMILKALHLGLTITEVPIDFFKDRSGRVSNVKRGGWLTPFRAGWDSLRIMFVYGADFFLFRPGVALAIIGFVFTTGLSFGPVDVGGVTLTLHSQFLTVTVAVIGSAAAFLGVVAKVANDLRGTERDRWVRRLAYNRVALAAGGVSAVGLALDAAFLVTYISAGFAVRPEQAVLSHLATSGLLLVIIGFLAFTSCLVVHAVADRLAALERSP